MISSHPAIAEVGMAGIPDAYSGEAVKARVMLRKGLKMGEEDLDQFCHTKLTGYKAPK
jgi:long-chain acyl-CoA synthetase